MLELALVAILLVAASVALHAFGTTYWTRHLVHRCAGLYGRFKGHAVLPAVTGTAIILMMLHVV